MDTDLTVLFIDRVIALLPQTFDDTTPSVTKKLYDTVFYDTYPLAFINTENKRSRGSLREVLGRFFAWFSYNS